MLTPEHPCPECGGQLRLARASGRFRTYRGEGGYEIPETMPVLTCQKCGALWLDSAMVSELGKAFEAERLRRRQPTFAVVITEPI